jgi:hypothetical protein
MANHFNDVPYLPESSDLEEYPPRTRKRRRRKAATSDGLNDMAATAAKLNVTKEKVRAFVRARDLQFINVGHGSKYLRYRFADEDINALIEKRRQQETPQCPSLKPRSPRHTSGTGSKSIVIGFMEARAARLEKKPKNLKR